MKPKLTRSDKLLLGLHCFVMLPMTFGSGLWGVFHLAWACRIVGAMMLALGVFVAFEVRGVWKNPGCVPDERMRTDGSAVSIPWLAFGLLLAGFQVVALSWGIWKYVLGAELLK